LVGLGHADAAAWLATIQDAPVSWADVLEEARRLRLVSFLHLGLTTAPGLRARVLPSILEAVRRAACASAVRATQLERLCAATVADASAAGIPVLVLKGPALASLVYPSLAIRPMDDVDLFVGAEHQGHLAEILCGHGYRNDLRGEEDFLPASRSVSIDVHTGLLNTTRIPARGALWPVTFDELWIRSQVCVLAGIPVRTLGPRDTIFHLAIHTVHHHGLGGAMWMLDLLGCLRAWPRALDGVKAEAPPVRRTLWYCLEVLTAHGQDVVPELRSTLRPRWLLPVEGWVLAARKRWDLPAEIRYALTVACLPGWRPKVAFLRQLLFPQAGVYTAGFGDGAEEDVPGWWEHWGAAVRASKETFRRSRIGRTDPVPSAQNRQQGS
jgi:hypothetical protein